MNFFDGQGILVREDAFPAADAGNSASALDGANICVGVGTTTEGNMQDWFSSRGIEFTSVGTADAAEATDKLISGECDAFTGDMSAMVAKKWALDNDASIAEGTWIASELLSKEPLGAATRDGDSDFKDVVAWVWYGMITAEEMGVTAANAVEMAASSCALTPVVEAVEDDPSTTDVDETVAADAGGAITNPGMCRLLTSDLGLGTTDNPVAGTWMQAVLAASGNYGEAYDDAFCDGMYDGVSGSDAMTGCLISRAGTANALVSEGGLQFAPPMR
jgi:general L-amino acid transport system substrate-binding protein